MFTLHRISGVLDEEHRNNIMRGVANPGAGEWRCGAQENGDAAAAENYAEEWHDAVGDRDLLTMFSQLGDPKRVQATITSAQLHVPRLGRKH